MERDARWVFFDLGWTLVDETPAHLARFAVLRSPLPQLMQITDGEFLGECENAASRFADGPFRAALEQLGIEADTLPQAATHYDHSQERLYPGVAAFWRRLGGSYRLGIIANPSKGTSLRLESFGFRDLFSVVVASAETGLSKPDPRIFAHAQSLAGCSPGDITMVGDRRDNDIGPAKAGGWHTVRVLQGFSRMQTPRNALESPDQTIGCLTELSPQRTFKPPAA